MSWLSSFFDPAEGYNKAQEPLDQYYQQSQGYLNPYNQNGQAAYGNLSGAMQALLDPQALQDKWINGYHESEAAKNAEAMAQQHGLDAASGSGLLGSSAALKAIQAGTSNIGAQDRQSYLNDLMQKYLAGSQLAQGIYGQGANAANQLSQNANQMGQNSAQLAYNQQNAGGGLFSGLLGLAAPILGGVLGGPIGGALGAGISQHFGWSPSGSYNPSSSSGSGSGSSWNIGGK